MPAVHPLRDSVESAFEPGSGDPARLLALPPGLSVAGHDAIVAALTEAVASRRPLVVVHHGGVGAAVARSLVAEHADLSALAVEVPATTEGIELAAAEAARLPDDYREVVYDTAGRRFVPCARVRPLADPGNDAIPLAPGEVFLITGGAKGIGAECAVALARATGARLALLGRSPVTDDDVAGTLRRLTTLGVETAYHQVDICDADALREAVERIETTLGPVRGVLHSAGNNTPERIERITRSRLEQTLAPKLYGLDTMLSCVDRDGLRLVVTFGSIIGRTGLSGESSYAVANEAMARRVAELAGQLPGCRCLNIEWSVWANVGMGERLGVLDALIRGGLDPVPTDRGTDTLLRLLAQPSLPSTVTVTGRTPPVATVRYAAAPVPPMRFLEKLVAYTPGVELVAEAALSTDTDPYLADHRIDGVPVLPAVAGLEAMAQAAQAVRETNDLPTFSDVRFTSPISVSESGVHTIRVAALAHDNGEVEVVLRSAGTDFVVNHLGATCRFDTVHRPAETLASAGERTPQERGPHPYYGRLFFHGSRFAHLVGYHALSAYRCEAHVRGDAGRRWFGGFHPQRLVLGDLGARDAYIHVLQACIPHRRVLPVGVQAIRVYARPDGALRVRAHERAHDDDTYVFDVAVEDAHGTVCEEWDGLELRDTAAPIAWHTWPPELVGPYLARCAQRWHADPTIDLTVATTEEARGNASLDGVRFVRGVDCGAEHTPDGRIVHADGAGSASHLDGHVLTAVADNPVAVDWETAEPAEPDSWPLGPHGSRLVDTISARTGEPSRTAAARVWTCLEVLSKRGFGPAAPLTLDEEDADQQRVLLRSGDTVISSIVLPLDGATLAAVALGKGS